jgi:ubiquinol-cytochrome c reductase cytochrome b subunit
MTRSRALLGWIDARFPLSRAWKGHVSEYYAPKTLNGWYNFGLFGLIVLTIQILSGIILAMNYKPDAKLAFESVEYIMRDVPWGWLIRYAHSTGASLFFAVVYLHMFRALLYGSHREPRELLWTIGMLIFLVLMAEAFFGYLLPWGQMSYWGAQVIVNLFGSIPFIGADLATWIRGDYIISDATLNRFFALHVIALPIALIGLVAAHLVALHHVGSSSPDGIEFKKDINPATGTPRDGIPYFPYHVAKEAVAATVFLMIFAAIVFFAPEMGGYFLEPNNFVPADPLTTPEHIAPVWYFTPYYSILRAVPPLFGSQFPGVLAMGASVLILFPLPWLDRGKVKSIRYRGWYFKSALAAFVVAVAVLGYLGTVPSNVWGQSGAWLGGADRATVAARVFTTIYFLFFLLMPWYTSRDRTRPVPARLTYP